MHEREKFSVSRVCWKAVDHWLQSGGTAAALVRISCINWTRWLKKLKYLALKTKNWIKKSKVGENSKCNRRDWKLNLCQILNFGNVMNTKCKSTLMVWKLYCAVVPTWHSSLSWSVGKRDQRICPMLSRTTEMECMPLAVWVEIRVVNAGHILRQQTNSNTRRMSSWMQLVKQFGLGMSENEKLFLQFQIEFTSPSFKMDVLITCGK